ncbi:MAG: DUF4835 family protein [Bacteroidales bacterium]|jgi:hypothetical protein|nr:DUF4835 family protein [Bacteroidales bacterium]
MTIITNISRFAGILLISLLIHAGALNAQEIYCDVQINTQQVEGTDKKVFETLRTAIFEFINNRQWTNYNFNIEERIECTFLINVTARLSSDEFDAELNMALKRPIYNSAYNSTTLNYIDKDFKFKYVEYQPLEFVENTFTSNLTSVLAYYVYIFLGMDFDSYTLYGGTPYFEKAENIVNAAQTSGQTGWKSFESQKNRFWLVENFMNPSYQPIRKFMYEYHRQGLDVMYDDANKGRAAILKSMQYLEQVKEGWPNLFIMQLIIDAKSDEFINVFSEGSATEKTRAMNILKKLDPANSSKYDEIMK